MSEQKHTEISAEVVLKSASGREVTGSDTITSENLHEFAPSPETAGKVREYFTSLGFKAGALQGISFYLLGNTELFEKCFGDEIYVGEQGEVTCGEDRSDSLTLEELPEAIKDNIVSIVFTPPVTTFN